MLESIELDKQKEIVNVKGDLQLSFDEVLELAEDILKERDEKEMSDNYNTISGLDLMKKRLKDGGVFWKVSPYEMEQISAEQSQIDGIVELAKYDNLIKYYLLIKVTEEFFDDMEKHFADWFGSQGLMTTISEKKLDTIITGIEEIVNDNIELEGVGYNENANAYGSVPKNKMKDTREWIIKTLRE